jgi:hypothetical protein
MQHEQRRLVQRRDADGRRIRDRRGLAHWGVSFLVPMPV